MPHTISFLRNLHLASLPRSHQIYKILIGFEGIFTDWETNAKDSRDYQHEREERETKAREFARSITEDNFLEWKNRIIDYAAIESDDLATFPFFSKFLSL